MEVISPRPFSLLPGTAATCSPFNARVPGSCSLSERTVLLTVFWLAPARGWEGRFQFYWNKDLRPTIPVSMPSPSSAAFPIQIGSRNPHRTTTRKSAAFGTCRTLEMVSGIGSLLPAMALCTSRPAAAIFPPRCGYIAAAANPSPHLLMPAMMAAPPCARAIGHR